MSTVVVLPFSKQALSVLTCGNNACVHTVVASACLQQCLANPGAHQRICHDRHFDVVPGLPSITAGMLTDYSNGMCRDFKAAGAAQTTPADTPYHNLQSSFLVGSATCIKSCRSVRVLGAGASNTSDAFQAHPRLSPEMSIPCLCCLRNSSSFTLHTPRI